ncbi:MAG: hypothetical protein OXN21_14050 [Chloroflexota bacterium]|nr:hypothetical protein [Chloroflexota bacterium]
MQGTELAFPSDAAGLSAYYRREKDGSNSLDKDTVDDHIFGPLESGVNTTLAAPAKLVDVGNNFTVASLSLKNIDSLTSSVNLYYDDEGWIVAYLPMDEPASQIWQAKDIDWETPLITDINDNTLLDAINVVIDEALEETAIDHDDAGLGYYHWQHSEADNFLMLAVSNEERGEYPVQLAVPDSLTVNEVSSTMWISQGTNPQAPCAKVTVDDTDVIAETCTKGIYSATTSLTKSDGTSTHSWKLIQTERDGGASGALLMILYSSSG